MFEDPWPDRPSRIKTTALFLVPVLLAAAAGYRYLTTATPLTASDAVDLFRAGDRSGDTGSPRSGEDGARIPSERSARHRKAGGAGSDERVREMRVGAPAEQPARRRSSAARTEATSTEPRSDDAWHPGQPKEGVYTWDTEGYESFNGARRQFPSRTHRIITHETRSNTWTNHHVFSRERESWTRTRAEKDGYYTLYARNRIVFGPVTRDAEVTFDPPMLNNQVGEPIGTTWEGKWDGKTYGTYEGRLLGEDTVRIEGQEVDVTVLQLHMRMHGEVEGTSVMRFWVSSRHHMVIREHYRQDVTSGAAEYHAEWNMTIESLRPKR